ncbi:MAG: 23S rRNA (guanosine(2251)-2'-O)-methyltransferase RlmB [Actinomycetales bacterium]|nr:23S rRNA (guanosine(2251)-2'-O)-methyltransferase RlmB [Actinomycetales bacterium]
MAGNSQRRGAVRSTGSKKGAQVGSGGNRRRALTGKGPTPKAEERTYHPAARRERAAGDKAPTRTNRTNRTMPQADVIVGRNAVVEALRSGAPATRLILQTRADADARWREAIHLARSRNVPVEEIAKAAVDELAGGEVHQGMVLQLPEYDYASLDDVKQAHVLVALDGITDTGNLGAIARSAWAFDAGGLIVASRRSARVTAGAWKASAGALAHVPVVQVTNMTRALRELAADGRIVIGLDATEGVDLPAMRLDVLAERVVLVIGSEGAGLSRLVADVCDWRVRIPVQPGVDSLNASVAAGVCLYALARARADLEG